MSKRDGNTPDESKGSTVQALNDMRTGDADAMGRVYAKLVPALVRALHRHVEGLRTTNTSDIVNDVFVLLREQPEKLPEGLDRKQAIAFLLHIGVHRAIDARRRDRSKSMSVDDEIDLMNNDQIDEFVEREYDTFKVSLLQGTDSPLNQQQREILNRILDFQTKDDIAAEMGKSVRTVNRNLATIKARIASL